MSEYIVRCIESEEPNEIKTPYGSLYGYEHYELKEELVRCKDCKHLRVINSIAVYAECAKHGIRFLPFGKDDTRECFCSWAERKEE